MGGVEKTRGGGAERATSRDVARLAGVSHTAVSFVFNGRAQGNLSAETQEKIRKAAAQLGYRPNAVARGLRRRRTAVIGLVTDEIATSPFAGRLLRGAMDMAWSSEHLVLTVDSGQDPVTEDAAVAELLDRRVDGIIYAALSLRRARVPEGLHRTFAVLANCLPEDGSLPAVIPAERAGGRSAARVLLDAGHRRVALVGGLDDIATAERLRGFRDALRTVGLTAEKEWIMRTGGEIAAGYEGSAAAAGRCSRRRAAHGDRLLQRPGRRGSPPCRRAPGPRRARRSVRRRLRRPGTHGGFPQPASHHGRSAPSRDGRDGRPPAPGRHRQRDRAAGHHPAAGVPRRHAGFGGTSSQPVTSTSVPVTVSSAMSSPVGTPVPWPSPGRPRTVPAGSRPRGSVR